MGVENFWDNYNLITKRGKRFTYCYFIVETNRAFPSNVNFGDWVWFFSLKDLQIKSGEEDPRWEDHGFGDTYRRVSDQVRFDQNEYILVMKVVALDQQLTTSNGQGGPDPEVGVVFDPEPIVTDFLNQLGLMCGDWFHLIQASFALGDLPPTRIMREGCQDPFRMEDRIWKSLAAYADLRKEQYLLLQRCLSTYHRALKVARVDPQLAYFLLTSTFEPAATIYGSGEEIWENSPLGQDVIEKWPTFLQEMSIDQPTAQKIQIFVGEIYMKTHFYKIGKKFRDFHDRFFPDQFRNEKTWEFLSDLYYFRNKFIHAGEYFQVLNLTEPLRFNRKTKTGNFQTFSAGRLRPVRVAQLPSFHQLLEIMRLIFQKFVHHIHENRDSDEDRAIYKHENYSSRNTVTYTAKKPKMWGDLVLPADVHREMDFVELQKFRNSYRHMEKLVENREIRNAIDHGRDVLKNPLFDLQYRDC